MDAVAIASIVAVGITLGIVIFLVFKVRYLIKHTHSENK